MAWLAVASARAPSVAATTRADATSQTLARTRTSGAAWLERLAAEGARVVDASRSTGVDVTAPDAPERLAELAGAPVDILVNNAGTSGVRPLDELTDEEWQQQWDLHVMGPMR